MCVGGGLHLPLCQLVECRAEEPCPFSSQLVTILDVGSGEFDSVKVGHAPRLAGAAEVVQETHQVVLHSDKLVVLALWRGGAGCRRGRGRMQKGERQGGSSTKVTLNRTLTLVDQDTV